MISESAKRQQQHRFVCLFFLFCLLIDDDLGFVFSIDLRSSLGLMVGP
jgi:hypothetical protein